MINSVPFLIVAFYGLDDEIKCEIEEKYPNQCHTIGKYTDPYLLTVMQYNAVEQKMNEQVDLTASALVVGCGLRSLLQYSLDSIMICGSFCKTALIFSLPSMQKIKSISINTDPKADINQPLLSNHVIPETGNRFMLECDKN